MNNDNQTTALEPATEINPFVERTASFEPAAEKTENKRWPLVPFDPEAGFKFADLDGMWRTAKWFIESKLVPASFRNEAQLIVCWNRAAELGLRPGQALESMYVVSGKIGMLVNAQLAMVESRNLLADTPKVEYSGEGDELTCTITLRRKGRKTGHISSFSIRQAKTALIYDRNSTWRTYPERMLYNRALGFALSDVFPDVLMGMKSVEELRDYPVENNK
jgi:hypothetical protein